MAFRSDISINFELSPRIVTIAAPSEEVTIQDLHDTLVGIQDSIEGSEHPDLISTAGKEDLGGGVLVGLTSTLQNAQLAFEARSANLESGTATTADPLGKTLIDSTATFVTHGVERGNLVYNHADESKATILSVVSETELTHTTLTGGTDNQWEIGDSHEVYDIVQCNIDGGNLVAVNDVGGQISPVFPTFGTQVVRTSSSSATLQELSSIQYSSFNGGVTVDILNGTAGTTFPTGTPEQPVDNLTDALTIANDRGLKAFFVIGDITLSAGTFDNLGFQGESSTQSTITVDAAASVDGSRFSRCNLTGTFDGDVLVTDCTLQTITNVSGVFERCGLEGTITLGNSLPTSLLNCYAGAGDSGQPFPQKIDLGGSGQGLVVRNYFGGLSLTNKSGPEEITIDMPLGDLVIDNTLLGGTLNLRGIGGFQGLTQATLDNMQVDSNNLVIPPRLSQLWFIHGLDTAGVTITKTSRTATGVIQSITQDPGTGDVVVKRTGP